MKAFLIAMLISLPARADEACKTRLEACNDALEASLEVIRVQDEAIERLKGHVKTLQDRLEASSKEPVVPTWIWALAGALAGATAVTIIHK